MVTHLKHFLLLVPFFIFYQWKSTNCLFLKAVWGKLLISVFSKITIPTIREAKSAFNTYPGIFTKQIWRKGREKMSPEAFPHTMFNMNPFKLDNLAIVAKFYGVSTFYRWSYSPSRSFMCIKIKSVLCVIIVLAFSLLSSGREDYGQIATCSRINRIMSCVLLQHAVSTQIVHA